MNRKAFAPILALALIWSVPAGAAGGAAVRVQEGYDCDYGVYIPFTPSPRTGSYTFALYEGEGTSGAPEVTAEVDTAGSARQTVYPPLRYDVSGPSTWTLEVTARAPAGREAFDREATLVKTFETNPSCGCPAGTAGAFYAGDGSGKSPYQVGASEQLQHVNRHLGGSFRQVNHIDLSAYGSWTPIGGNSYAAFSGTYDGGGYKITGFTVGNTMQYSGLFGLVSGAVIQNLGVQDYNVNAPGSDYVAGLIGQIGNASSLRRCFSRGGTVRAGGDTGPLVAYALGEANNTMEDCYVNGTVVIGGQKRTASAGGFNGNPFAFSTISNCYALPASVSCHYVGGFDSAGYSTVYANCCWSTNIASYASAYNMKNPPGTRGYTTAQLTNPDLRATVYSGFDFDTVWIWDDHMGAPKLRVEKE